MKANRDTMLEMAGKLGYHSLTKLQETAFQNEHLYDDEQNIMVIGPTSSGKTLVPVLLYARAVLETEKKGEPAPKLLFIVPYRALAAQKTRELRQQLERLLDRRIYIAQSTGEIRQADDDISSGQVDAGVVINEKAFLFAGSDAHFLSRYQYIVMDEIGLLADLDRGIKLDFLLSWARGSRPRPRVVALATPFYDWKLYQEHYHFEIVASEERPRLLDCPVLLQGKTIHYVDNSQWEDSHRLPSYVIYRQGKASWSCCQETGQLCLMEQPCRQDGSIPCTHTGRICSSMAEPIEAGGSYRYKVVADLCRWHIQQKHQVLVFWNNREECRQLALYLFHDLRDVLREPPELEECKREILQSCTDISNEESDLKRTELISEDEMFGVLEPEHYQALYAGIGFHSSAVPLELRSYVERQFLEQKKLSVVCATETLAFGVNSAVDAVVIADMRKNLVTGNEFLGANSYFNYIGRCGRLQPDRPMDEIVGWVHPILTSTGNGTLSEYDEWKALKQQKPEIMESAIFRNKGESLPFLLLCLLGREKRSRAEMEQWVEALPSQEESIPGNIGNALQYLLDHELIEDTDNGGWDDETVDVNDPDKIYQVVSGRERLCRFILSGKDFDMILEGLRDAMERPDLLFEVVLLYRLTGTGYMENTIRSLQTRTEEEDDPSGEIRRREKVLSAEKLQALVNKLPVRDKMMPLVELVGEKMEDPDVRRRLVMTATVLCWASSANPRRLYEWFGISYPLIQRVTQELGYLLEVAAACTYAGIRRPNEKQADFEERKAAVSERITVLERSVYFGLEPDMHRKICAFFEKRSRNSETAERLKQTIESPYPGTARQIRRIFGAYMVLLDAAKRQKEGYGAEPYQVVGAALREIMAWNSSPRPSSALWREFSFALKDEVEQDEHRISE